MQEKRLNVSRCPSGGLNRDNMKLAPKIYNKQTHIHVIATLFEQKSLQFSPEAVVYFQQSLK